MRYVLSAVIVCAVGMPAASALPTMRASAVSLSNTDMVVAVAKRSSGGSRSANTGASGSSKSAKTTKAKKQDNGIHPLVGSGDY